MKPKATLRSFLAIAGSSLLAISSASAATFTWGSLVDVTPSVTNWSSGTSWSGVPVSAADTTLVFAPTWGSNSTTETNTLTNDVANPFQLNVLTLGVSTPAAASGSFIATFNIAGSPLEFVLNGATTPVVNLNANRSAGQVVVYDVQTNLVLSANTLFTGNGTASFTISGAISGGGSLTKSGISTLTLSNASNSYTNGTTISGGTLSVGVVANLGNASSNLVFDGGTLQITGTAINSFLGAGAIGRTVSFTSGKTVGLDINTAGNTFIADKVLNQGTGGLIKAGAGILQLDQINTYTGSTVISAGTLSITGSGSLGSGTYAGVIWNTGTLIHSSSANQTLSGVIIGTGALTKNTSATSTLTLSAANTFSGLTTVSTGTLTLTNALALQNSALVTTSGTSTLSGITGALTVGGLSGSRDLGSADVLFGYTGNISALTLNPSGSVTYTGIIANGTGTMPLTKTGAGTQVLQGANTYTGATNINAGTLTLSGAAGALASTAINLNGSALTLINTSLAEAGVNRVSNSASIISTGGAITVTNTASLTTVYSENMGTLDLRSGQLNVTQTTANTADVATQTLTFGTDSLTNVNGVARTSATTSAVTFSGASLGLNVRNSIIITGQGNSGVGEIIAPWATFGTSAAAQTDYASYNRTAGGALNAFGVQNANITASAQSTWSTTTAATSNYTMSALASATISGGTKNINTVRSTNNAVTVTSGNANIPLAGHSLVAGDVVTFSAATIPTGLTAGTPYYVVSPVAGTSIQVSLTSGGTAITPTSAGGTVVASGAIQVASGQNLGTTGILNGSTTTLNILQSGGAGVVTLPTTTADNLHVNAGSGAITISAPIADNTVTGVLSLVKNGAGILTLSGNNTYTGTTAINVGQVTITNASALGTTAGNTTIASTGSTSTGGRLSFSTGAGNAITVAENITITGNSIGGTSAINNSGQAAVTLSGAITLSSLTGAIRFDTNNSGSNMIFSGTLTQTGSSQTLILAPSSSGGQNIVFNNPISLNGGTLQVSSGGAGFIILKGVNANAADGIGIGQTVITLGGTLRLGVSDALNTTANLNIGNASATDTGTFSLLGFSQTVNALVSGGSSAVRIVQNSHASLASTLIVGNGGGSGTFLGTIVNGAAGTLALIKTGVGNQTLNDVNSYTGGTRIDGGILTLGHATNTLADTGAVNINGGTLDLGTNTDTVGAVTLTSGSITGSGAGTLTGSAYDVRSGTVSAKLGGLVGLTKTTAGTVTLSGGNTYSGATAVNDGTLRVNGNQSTATGNVTVAANAALGGTGTIGGSTTIAAGGKLEFNLSTIAASHDPLDISSGKTLTFSGASVLTITTSGGATPGTYTLITGGNNITGVAPATLNLPVGWAATVSISGNSLLLNVTSTGQSPYETWAVGGVAFNADTNGDGVKNGMAWLLGALNPSENALNKLPQASRNGTNLRLTFRCLKSTKRGGMVLKVQSSTDLGASDPWTSHEAAVPDLDLTVNGVIFDTTDDGDFINVIADIPSGGARVFGRLVAIP